MPKNISLGREKTEAGPVLLMFRQGIFRQIALENRQIRIIKLFEITEGIPDILCVVHLFPQISLYLKYGFLKNDEKNVLFFFLGIKSQREIFCNLLKIYNICL